MSFEVGKWAEYKLMPCTFSPPGHCHHVPPYDCLRHLWLQKLGSPQRFRAYCHWSPNYCHFFLFGTEQWLCHEPSPRPESQTFHCFSRMGVWGLHVSNNGGWGRERVMLCFIGEGCALNWTVQTGGRRSSAQSGHGCGMFHWWLVIWGVCVWQRQQDGDRQRQRSCR